MTDLYGAFERTATEHADRPFCWYGGQTTTYAEARAAIDRRAALLESIGLDPGDTLGLLLPNDPEFLFLLFAAARQGVTVAPFNYRQEGAVLSYLIDDAAPAALVVDADVFDGFTAIESDVSVDTVLTHDVDHGAPDTRDLDESIADGPARAGERPPVDGRDVAILNYTSGTTGPPKGVRNPHRAFLDGGERAAAACRTDRTDRALLVLPLFHANPLTYGVMHMLAVGGSVAPVRSFSASEFWETARRADATYFTHVGSVLEILVRRADDVDDTTTPMRFGMGGAAQFDAQAAFEDRFDIQLIRLYGLSEVGAGLVTVCEYDPTIDHHPRHQGSIDDIPFDVRILGEDGLSWATTGERGEIVIRPENPATMFRGYLGKAEKTVEDWQDLWMHTGDLGTIDRAGNLHLVGRRKTSIRKHGENVSPWEIETAFANWVAVEDVVAVGVPDPVAGEEIKLYVRPIADDLTEADVYRYGRRTLPEHLVPRYVEFVDAIPRTSTQKVERTRLRDRGVDGAWDRTDRIDGEP